MKPRWVINPLHTTENGVQLMFRSMCSQYPSECCDTSFRGSNTKSWSVTDFLLRANQSIVAHSWPHCVQRMLDAIKHDAIASLFMYMYVDIANHALEIRWHSMKISRV